MKKTNYIAELTFLGFLLLITAAFITQLIEPENDPLQIVDSVEYARVIVGLLLAAILVVIWQTAAKFAAYLKEHPAEEKSGDSKNDGLVRKLVIATCLVFFFYCFFMQRLGYYTTGLIVLELYQMVLYTAQNGRLDRSGMLKITAIAAGVTVALYLIFSVAFQLYLPRGVLL